MLGWIKRRLLTTDSAATTTAEARRTASYAAALAPKVVEIPHDKIAARAAEIWDRKGRPHGQDEQNWKEAEAELRAEFAANPEQLLFDKSGIPEEILKLRPPTTAAQAAARCRANEALETKYPVGSYVAYVDNWNGDELNRVVVAASTDWDEYQQQLNSLPAAICDRLELDRIRDPEVGLRGLYPRLVEGD